jgi:hypothetical protein
LVLGPLLFLIFINISPKFVRDNQSYSIGR